MQGISPTSSKQASSSPLPAPSASQLKIAVQLKETAYFQEALCLFETLADQGFSDAHFHLGTMYLTGMGVEPNEATAMGHFTQAAKLDADGPNTAKWLNPYNHGYLYENGYGIEQNYNEAYRFYVLSASANPAGAMEHIAIGSLIERGLVETLRSEQPDLETANAWYETGLRRNSVSPYEKEHLLHKIAVNKETLLKKSLTK